MRQFSRLCPWHHFDSPETPRAQFHISITARAEVLNVRAKKFSPLAGLKFQPGLKFAILNKGLLCLLVRSTKQV